MNRRQARPISEVELDVTRAERIGMVLSGFVMGGLILVVLLLVSVR